ncbi:hypothetical protein QR680_010440 [Steinernema hermaphroditum]|uniref:Bud22 domain-containing protein n=1 Tax=Steinernema hermaphroditum TaxID=289476 RepID=A0AA39IP10_9BILA|nr:hypothetical protein QR680_010440 [Steinernema hermaphroditum]
MSETPELTAKTLNNEIVKFRPVVDRCAKRKTRELLRRGKQWTTFKNPTKQRRGKDLIEMALVLKHVDKDEVTKFALQNTKTSTELFNMKEATLKHRALFHLIADKPFVAAVDAFRERYPSWPLEVPFHLQRLGLKYAKNKTEKRGASLKDLYLPKKDNDGDESDEDDIADLGGIVGDAPHSSDEDNDGDQSEEDDIANLGGIVGEASHPAEEANRKQEEEMASGSADEKSKLDDDGSTSKTQQAPKRRTNPSREAKSKLKKKTASGPPVRKIKAGVDKSAPKTQQAPKPKQEALHPSWEAKRKLKEQMTSGPSGKKIKFGNDGPAPKTQEATKPKPETLHPSWEAKRKLKEQMASGPSGKKITFGDD